MTAVGSVRQLSPIQTTTLVSLVVLAYAAGYFVLPFETYLLSTTFVVVTAAGLLGSYLAFDHGDVPLASRVTVPRWFLLGALVVVGFAAVTVDAGALAAQGDLVEAPDLAKAESFSALAVALWTAALGVGALFEATAYVALVAIPGAFLASVALRAVIGESTSRRYVLPLWITGGVGLFVGLLVVGGVVFGLSLYELALLSVLMATALYVGFIVPVAVWEMASASRPPVPTEPYPEVSVLIPAYNEAGSVGRCIESLLATDYPAEKREVVVVDDGSTDGTYEAALQYADRGVRVLRRPNGGRDAALNYGIFCSNGDVLVVLDADSVLTRDSLKIVAGALQADPELGAVAGDVRVMYATSLLTKAQAIEYVYSINTFRRACSFFGAVPIAPGALSGFRREALEAVDGFDPDTIVEDFDTTVQVLDAGWTVRQVSAHALTEAPFSWRDLWTQRVRWYTGTLQVLAKHPHLFVDSRSNYLHRFTLPWVALSYFFRAVFGPAMTVVIAYGLVTTQDPALAAGVLYFVALTGLAAAITIYMLNESFRLLPWYVLLLVGYKQFIDVVFLRCTVGYLLGREVAWGTIKRQADVVQ